MATSRMRRKSYRTAGFSIMYATLDDTVLANSISPSGFALAANQLPPRMLPPPGMLRMRTVGPPGMCFSR